MDEAGKLERCSEAMRLPLTALLLAALGCDAEAATLVERPRVEPTAVDEHAARHFLVDGCPQEMVRVGKFCVDRYEAHLVSYASGEVIHPHNQRPDPNTVYVARSAPSVFPQAYVSRNESEAACKQAGKRLCTFSEWRRACRGSRGQHYPYGHVEVRGACSSGKDHLLPRLHGSDSAQWKYEEHFNDPKLGVVPGFLDRTGAHSRCASEEGVFDLVGNLHEWVSGKVTEELMARLERDDVERDEQPWTEGNGIFVGGFFSTARELGPGCLYTTVAHEPGYHDYSTGFRCCMDAS